MEPEGERSFTPEEILKIRQIITREFDLELFLKRREQAILREEISRGTEYLQALTNLILHEGETPLSASIVTRSRTEPVYATRSDYTSSTRTRKTRRPTTIDAPGSEFLYARRHDGVYVRLKCVDCGRVEFTSMQGFVNHARLKHQQEYFGHEHAIRVCGIPVEESEVPPNHPARRYMSSQVSVMDLIANNRPLDQKPAIREYDPDAPPTSGTITPVLSASDRDLVSTPLPPPFPLSTPSTPSAAPPSLHERPKESRYYIKRRLILGNVSQFIPPSQRPEGAPDTTHRWMVYVTGEEGRRDDPLTYIRKVRFFLHPSYKPADVVDITTPPFQLSQTGWGEFPIRVRIFFIDKRNKAVDVIHLLKLDQTHSGSQVLGMEKTVEISLDRRTQFINPSVTEARRKKPQLSPGEVYDVVQGILTSILKKHPLITEDATALANPDRYRVAPTLEAWTAWPAGKRMSSEMRRARIIRAELIKATKEADPPVAMQTASLSVSSTLARCREVEKATFSSLPKVKPAHDAIYCRSCGHVLMASKQHPPEACKACDRPAVPPSITCSAQDLLVSLQTAVSEEVDDDFDMDIDIDDSFSSTVPCDLGALEGIAADPSEANALRFVDEAITTFSSTGVTPPDLRELQRPAVAAISIAMQGWLCDLVHASIGTVKAAGEPDIPKGTPSTILTPMHVAQAVTLHPDRFDLLSERFLGLDPTP